MSDVYTILNTIRADMKASITETNGYDNTPVIVNGYVLWDKADRYPMIGFYVEEESIQSYVDAETNMTGQLTLFVYGFCYAGTGDNQQEPILELSDDALHFFFNSDNTYKSSTYLVEGRTYNFGVNKEDNNTILTFHFKVMVEYEIGVSTIKD